MIDVCFFADEVSKDFDEAVKLGVEAGANAIEIRGGLWGQSVTTIDDDGVAVSLASARKRAPSLMRWATALP